MTESYSLSPVSRREIQRPARRTGYAGTPTIRNARSLSFPFHSPAPWKRVSVASTASPRAVLQCPAVEVREGLGRSPGRAIGHLIPRHSTQVRDGLRASCRGAAFDLRCRSCQATSSITSTVPLNEIASAARLASNSAYIGAWVEMPMISLPSRAGRRDHAGLSTTCPI
jgi:hypothetical protein